MQLRHTWLKCVIRTLASTVIWNQPESTTWLLTPSPNPPAIEWLAAVSAWHSLTEQTDKVPTQCPFP